MMGSGRTLWMTAAIAFTSGTAFAQIEAVTFGTTAGHVRFL